jgi:hypothetical protein
MKLLIVSSQFFLFPTILSMYYHNYKFFLTSFYVYCSSMLHHDRYTTLSFWFDQLAIYNLIIRGICHNLKLSKKKQMFYWFTLLYITYIYLYGKISKKYCFDRDSTKADKWHATTHIISSTSACYIIYRIHMSKNKVIPY